MVFINFNATKLVNFDELFPRSNAILYANDARVPKSIRIVRKTKARGKRGQTHNLCFEAPIFKMTLRVCVGNLTFSEWALIIFGHVFTSRVYPSVCLSIYCSFVFRLYLHLSNYLIIKMCYIMFVQLFSFRWIIDKARKKSQMSICKFKK